MYAQSGRGNLTSRWTGGVFRGTVAGASGLLLLLWSGGVAYCETALPEGAGIISHGDFGREELESRREVHSGNWEIRDGALYGEVPGADSLDDYMAEDEPASIVSYIWTSGYIDNARVYRLAGVPPREIMPRERGLSVSQWFGFNEIDRGIPDGIETVVESPAEVFMRNFPDFTKGGGTYSPRTDPVPSIIDDGCLELRAGEGGQRRFTHPSRPLRAG